jgi:type IV pilus assembly protein PilM
MLFPFRRVVAKRQRVVAIALGSRTTKAVLLERNSHGFALAGFTVLDSPDRDRKGAFPSADQLTDHFKSIRQVLGAKANRMVLALTLGDTLLRHVDMPLVAPADMRIMLEISSKNYFQEDLPDHLFDCCVIHAKAPEHTSLPVTSDSSTVMDFAERRPMPSSSRSAPKGKVFVGAVKRELVEVLQTSAKDAGFVIEEMTASQLGQASAVSFLPDLPENEAVATLDVGFRHSSICILLGGEVVHSRVVAFGGDKLTRGLAEAMNVSYEAAEGVKLVLLDKVQQTWQGLISPLGYELKASMEFFEDQYERKVGCVFVSGGSARSSLIVQALQDSIARPIKHWDPSTTVSLSVPEDQVEEVQRESPQLAIAIGAGLGWLDPKRGRINFLAGQQEEEEARRRDPVRLGWRVAAGLLALMVLWSIILGFKSLSTSSLLKGELDRLSSAQKKADEVARYSKKIAENGQQISSLVEFASNRFLWAVPLDALQLTLVKDFVVTRISIEQALIHKEPTKPKEEGKRGEPGKTTEIITMTIQAKDYADPGATEAFIETLAENPYFKANLRVESPITLKNRVSRQVDTTDPTKSFSLVTLECVFRERLLANE